MTRFRTKLGTISRKRIDWLRQKAAKDKTDIIALLDPSPRKPLVSATIDSGQLGSLVSEYSLLNFVKSTLDDLSEDEQAIQSYSRDLDARSLKQ